MQKDQKLISSAIEKVTQLILGGGIKTATKYLTPTLIVRAVISTYKVYGRIPKKGDNIEIRLTVGRPNVKERDFVKTFKSAKEPFPVRNVMIKLLPPKKK